MALEFIAALVAAVGFGGLALAFRRLSGGRAPKWIVPVAAALGLLSVTVLSEYGWYDRVTAELPEGVSVVWSEDGAHPLRPWTYLAPVTLRFIAMDVRNLTQDPANTDLRMAPVYRMERWRPVDQALMLIDCAGRRRALLTSDIVRDGSGAIVGADWIGAPSDDRFLAAACPEV